MGTNRQTAIVTALLAASVALNVVQCVGSRRSGQVRTKADTVTVTRTDTLMSLVPTADTVLAVRTDTVRLAVVRETVRTDTVFADDSVRVAVPISQSHYRDSLYEAWVSGYRARLDSILVFGRVVERTVYTSKPDGRRWNVSVQAGYGLGRGGWSPYVGVGVGYALWRW